MGRAAMRYFVARKVAEVPASEEPVGILIHDEGWNDWYKYRTVFNLHVRNGKETQSVGGTKIGQRGLTAAASKPNLPLVFEELGDDFFSLGQNEDYYETAVAMMEKYGVDILSDLRDISKNTMIYASVRDEDVLHESLMRFVQKSQVEGRFHRLAMGDARLTEFAFAHVPPGGTELPTIADYDGVDGSLSFSVDPSSIPPTNIHVLIGRNGVGKTTRLTAMIHSLLGLNDGANNGRLVFYGKDPWTDEVETKAEPDFTSLCSVSFSAFDPFTPPSREMYAASNVAYSYIGLKKPTSSAKNDLSLADTYSRKELRRQFVESASLCRKGLRGQRWASALAILEADPLFAEARVGDLIHDVDGIEWEDRAAKLFRLLSSGHGIVLLTITRLVELVDERTLVLLDEPEGHLHPPLLSAFVRALSSLLTKRNGVAVIATHSPVVLQEVPRSCVWYMSRSTTTIWADRPERETFGENVGVLTRDVFGLEVKKSGFHQMVEDAARKTDGSFEAILDYFDGELGAEAKAIARALSAAHRKQG